MNKSITLFFSLISLIGCGTGTGSYDYPGADQRFYPYLKTFEDRAASFGSSAKVGNMSIKMVPSLKNPQTVAVCYRGLTSDPRIEVSQEHWNDLTIEEKEEMIFHELGHCVLSRAHREDKDSGYPLSIMNPYVLSRTTYTSNYNQYQYELFKKQDLSSELPLKWNFEFYSSASLASNYPSFSQYNNNASTVEPTPETNGPEIVRFRCDDGEVVSE